LGVFYYIFFVINEQIEIPGKRPDNNLRQICVFQVKQQEAERDLSDTRPLSDSSSYEDQMSVRLRDSKLSPRAQVGFVFTE
jgi:hypothetical protein